MCWMIRQENEEELDDSGEARGSPRAKRPRRHVEYSEAGVTQSKEEMESSMAHAGMTKHTRKTQQVAMDGSLYWRYV